jgi:hypothetical protein
MMRGEAAFQIGLHLSGSTKNVLRHSPKTTYPESREAGEGSAPLQRRVSLG